MSVSLIYIRRWTLLTILRLRKLVSEFTYITALSALPSTIGGWVLTPRSINYVIKVMSSYCDTIAIGDTPYEYKLFWSQLSINRFVSPRASESALPYSHQVRNSLIIAANDRTLNLTTLYCSQIYCIVQLSCFAIYWTESIPRHSGHINPKAYLLWPRGCGWNKGWFLYIDLGDRTPIHQVLITSLSLIWLCIFLDEVVVLYWRHLIS